MQDRRLYEYALIRLVPKVEREEFLNVGVIIYCAESAFLEARYLLDPLRLQAFCPDPDLEWLEKNLHSFRQICAGDPQFGPIARLDGASRFRWLTAVRSTILQTSRVHSGFCKDEQEVLAQLFEQMVLL